MPTTSLQGDVDVVTEFIEQLGLLTESVGMPRIAGRIMGLLLLTEAPLDLEGIAERLQISHGSVSTNTRLLENLAVLERVTTPGDRRVRFRLSPDQGSQFLERDLQRQQRIQSLVRTTLDALPADSYGRANLERMHAFHTLAIRRTTEMLAEWNEHLRTTQQRTPRPAPTSRN